ncbi:hypothetical protein [Roseiconus lacunae]|uniref:Uncharacterized protein n=1 Tax=Roseiconus lacunae TaxID=2605694 RepID=A0ABT7PT21_9BACT|nr:hypothetical protein [Roseiconus lacunae]MDM4019481.1 hypothetical protein [Roseiconus lacunae]
MTPKHEFDCSGDWVLYDVRLGAGLELIVERDSASGRDLETPLPRRQIAFWNPASWAFIDMSLIAQYFPYDDCPPVLAELSRMDTQTFIPDFTVNTESHGGGWRHFRVVTHSEIVDVIAQREPEVKALTD